jgi:hypothetical protein
MKQIKIYEEEIQDGISHWAVDKPSIIGLCIQIVITVTVLVIGILFFEIIRKYNWGKLIYFKRLIVLPGNTPEYKNGFVNLIKHIASVPEEWIIDNIGLDAAMFIKMFKLGLMIFAFGSFIVAPVLIPINYYAQIPDYDNYDNTTMPFLSIGLKRFSIANVPNNSNLHIVHAVFIYVFTFFVCKKLYDYYLEYLRYEYNYKREETIKAHKERLDELIQFRTVLVQGIPPNYRTDKALKQWFIDHDIGEVESAFVMRDFDEYLVNINYKRDKALRRLEKAYCTWINNILEYKRKNSRLIEQSNSSGNDLNEIVTSSENNKNKNKDEEDEDNEKSFINLDEPTLSNAELSALKKELIDIEEDVVDNVGRTVNKINANSADDTNDNHGDNDTDMDETTPMLNRSALDMNFIVESLRPVAIKKSGGHFVDSIDYYTEKLITYTKVLKDIRLRFFDDETNESSIYTSSGFVTFKSQHSSTIASQVLLCSSNNTFDMICTPAPHCNDVIWDNIDVSVKRKILQNFTLTIFTIIVIIFWSIPVSFISGLASIDKLENVEWLKEHLPWLVNIENLELLQTFIPPIITSLFMTLAPYVFYFISSFQCFESYSAKEQSVMGKYYIFLLTNLLFVFAISNAFITFITALFQSPLSILHTIGSLIPQGSTYFINLVVHYPVSLVTTFTKPYLPFLYWFEKKLCKTPRDYYDLKNETLYPDYCYNLPPALVIIVISIVYSIISPLILFAGFIFCLVGYFSFKYQILYFYVKEWEFYGKNWVFVHDRILGGLILLQVIMLGIFEVKGCYFTGIALIPAIIYTTVYYYFFKSTYEKRTIHLPLDQYSSSSIDYVHYKKEQKKPKEKGKEKEKEKEEEEEESKDIQEMHLEEIKNNAEQAKELKTAKTPSFYENHSYFCPLITSNLSGIWIPSIAKEVLGKENLEKIGRLPDNENYEFIKEKYKLTEEDLQIPYYFDDKWKEK